jgi:hypothetical protein
MSLIPPETSLLLLAEWAGVGKGKHPSNRGRNTTLGGSVSVSVA